MGIESREQILQLLKAGESEIVEFKSQLPPEHVLARIIVAFANTGGGYLFIGVGDNGRLVGIPDDELNIITAKVIILAKSLLPYPIQVNQFEIDDKRAVCFFIGKAPKFSSPIMTSRGELVQRVKHKIIVVARQQKLRSTGRPVAKSRDTSAPLVTLFIAMSFHEEEEPALVDYFRAIKRAVADTKLPISIKRVDLVEGDYEISSQIMNEIDQAQIVLADFTLSPANVYFELGYARGKDRAIIQTARKGTPLEFDVRNWHTVIYRNATELEAKLPIELIAAYKKATHR